ncbi:diguanylate cyclase [Vibrio sp. SM6]|uniref:Diguanylate cyclase n=1 Tax=Vibrio agarilyticus TaxID=2726741 RepID=A0A7X8TQ44_9VIBR|nr:diguanylate cyclase [Vibrio agarilyticus]NLS12163.1 diguanylate cyclase [Vibrio agarilyticus]
MSWFNALPLRLKLIVPTWAILTTCIVACGVFSITWVTESRSQALYDRIHILSHGIASTLRNPLVFNDVKAAKEQLSHLQFDPEIIAAQVVDSADKPVAFISELPSDCQWKTDANNASSIDIIDKHRHKRSQQPILCAETQYVAFQTDIVAQNRRLGWLTVWVSLNSLNQQQNQLWEILVLVTAALSFLSWLFARLVHRMVTLPIQRLCTSMQMMTREGVICAELPIERQDELGTLTQCFNNLAVSLREREQQLQLALKRVEEKNNYIYQALDTMKQGVMVVSDCNLISFHNPMARKVLPNLRLHYHMRMAFDGQFEPRAQVELLLSAIEKGQHLANIHLIDRISRRQLRFSCHPMASESNMLLQCEDITEHQLGKRRQKMIDLMFEQNQDAIFVLSRHFKVETQNTIAHKWFGPVNQLNQFEIEKEHVLPFRVVRSLLRNGHYRQKLQIRNRASVWLPCRIKLRVLSDERHKAVAFVLTISDRTNEMQIRKLSHAVNHDALTGLANRSRAREFLQASHNNGINQHLFFIDLDGFKAVNDQYGHAVGDDALKTIGKRLRNCVRRSDLVARLSGDEFLVAVQRNRDPEQTAQRLLSQITKPMMIGSVAPNVGASIGIRYWPADALIELDQIINDADSAMYQAKRGGKSRYCYFSDGDKTPGANAPEADLNRNASDAELLPLLH